MYTFSLSSPFLSQSPYPVLLPRLFFPLSTSCHFATPSYLPRTPDLFRAMLPHDSLTKGPSPSQLEDLMKRLGLCLATVRLFLPHKDSHQPGMPAGHCRHKTAQLIKQHWESTDRNCYIQMPPRTSLQAVLTGEKWFWMDVLCPLITDDSGFCRLDYTRQQNEQFFFSQTWKVIFTKDLLCRKLKITQDFASWTAYGVVVCKATLWRQEGWANRDGVVDRLSRRFDCGSSIPGRTFGS